MCLQGNIPILMKFRMNVVLKKIFAQYFFFLIGSGRCWRGENHPQSGAKHILSNISEIIKDNVSAYIDEIGVF